MLCVQDKGSENNSGSFCSGRRRACSGCASEQNGKRGLLLPEREMSGGFSESAKKMEKGLEGIKTFFFGPEELRE